MDIDSQKFTCPHTGDSEPGWRTGLGSRVALTVHMGGAGSTSPTYVGTRGVTNQKRGCGRTGNRTHDFVGNAWGPNH